MSYSKGPNHVIEKVLTKETLDIRLHLVKRSAYLVDMHNSKESPRASLYSDDRRRCHLRRVSDLLCQWIFFFYKKKKLVTKLSHKVLSLLRSIESSSRRYSNIDDK